MTCPLMGVQRLGNVGSLGVHALARGIRKDLGVIDVFPRDKCPRLVRIRLDWSVSDVVFPRLGKRHIRTELALVTASGNLVSTCVATPLSHSRKPPYAPLSGIVQRANPNDVRDEGGGCMLAVRSGERHSRSFSEESLHHQISGWWDEIVDAMVRPTHMIRLTPPIGLGNGGLEFGLDSFWKWLVGHGGEILLARFANIQHGCPRALLSGNGEIGLIFISSIVDRR